MIQGRIVLDARILRGKPGGVATYIQALVDHLPALLPNVPIVLLRHPNCDGQLSTAANVSEWSLGWPPNGLWTYFQMGRWLNSRVSSNDLFHAPQRIIPKHLKAKSVVTVHDLMHIVCPELALPNPVKRAMNAPYLSRAIRSSIERADRVIAVSQFTADEAIRIVPSAAERIRVVRHGKSQWFKPIDKTDAESLTTAIVPPRRRFFLVLGGGYPNKNHVAAVSAFARAFPTSDDIHLLVIQRERTFPPELRRVLRRPNMQDRVQIQSSVDNEQLVALYNRAEALVFPSLYEGFGLPVLEAMACGCPVICSNVTSLPEVSGNAALIVGPNDEEAIAEAMSRIVRDQNLKRALIERGIQQAAHFDWKKTARETAFAYREIAEWIHVPIS